MRRRSTPLGWWYGLVALSEPPIGATLRERERTRHSRLVAIFLLAFLLIEVGGLYQYVVVDSDHPPMIALLLIACAVLILIGGLNRVGYVTLAGLLMVLLADLSLPSIPATGEVDLQHLGAFYLSIASLLVAASVLPAVTVFPIAVINSAAVLSIIFFLPHTAEFDSVLRSNDAQQVLAGPLLMQIIVAIVAYLWANSMVRAMRRADRAEEIAYLQRRAANQQVELEEGVRQLLAVHAQVASGDFRVRTSGLRNPLLWRVGSSLNALIARLSRTAQADYLLRLEQEEARRLAEAIYLTRSGRQAIWPAPTGLPLDIVLEALRTRPRMIGRGPSGPFSGPLQRPGGSDATWGRQRQPLADPRNDLPDWLRPSDLSDES